MVGDSGQQIAGEGTLQHALCGGAKAGRRAVRYVRAAGRPHRRVGHALHELERQHPPWVTEPCDVQEAQHVAG